MTLNFAWGKRRITLKNRGVRKRESWEARNFSCYEAGLIKVRRR